MQVQQTAVQIRESSEKITAMEANPESMREDYARMVYYAYVNDKEYEPIHFCLLGSINDAYTEIEYVREYTTYRKQQAAAIQGYSGCNLSCA